MTSKMTLLISLISTALCPSTVTAQATPGAIDRPDVQVVDGAGLDILTGSLNWPAPSISIGSPSQPEMGIDYYYFPVSQASDKGIALTGDVYQSCQPIPYSPCSLYGYRFNYSGQWDEINISPPSSFSSRGSMYSVNADSIILTQENGQILEFSKSLGDNIVQPDNSINVGKIKSVTRPNGTKLTYNYDGNKILKSITSSSGYMLILTRDSSQSSYSNIQLINLASVYCDVVATSCSMGLGWPNVAFSGLGTNHRVATNSTGQSIIIDSNLTSSNGSATTSATYKYTMPNGSQRSFTQTSTCAFFPVTSVTMPDGVWTYTYTYESTQSGYCNGRISKIVARSPAGISTIYDKPAGINTVLTDPLLRKTEYTFNIDNQPISGVNYAGRISKILYPEGNSVSYQYRGLHVSKVIITPKNGSGPNIELSSEYNVSCSISTMRTCNQPSSSKDGLGNVTNYTYDPEHGGVLTVTSPADGSGVQAVKRSAYVSRYAWLSNGSNGFVRAATPIWLLSQERTCRKTATNANANGASIGCAGGAADEVVTAYDYGPDDGSIGNNLLLRSISVSSDNVTRRTCYGYDREGNRIFETKPLAGLMTCPA